MLFRLFTLLAVAALAIITWFSSSPARRPPAAAGAGSAGLPGYYLKGAVLTDYDAAGKPAIRLEAERIDQVDHGSDVLLSAVKLDYQAPSGQNWVMVGDSGRIVGGNVIDLTGHVHLTGDAAGQSTPASVETDAMSYDVGLAKVSTREEVSIRIGEDATLSARGLVANLKDRTLHLDAKVHGRFLP
jgi:LPS export ABC transporter protein LptC